jgi:hypothetical protein
MRLTIVAGLIAGTALAIQSIVGAHTRARSNDAASGVHVHVRVVAPWYIAANNTVHGAEHVADTRQSHHAAKPV